MSQKVEMSHLRTASGNILPGSISGSNALSSVKNSPPVAVFSYCMGSILMTLTNKYVLSSKNFNFVCILLAIQVCLTKYSIV